MKSKLISLFCGLLSFNLYSQTNPRCDSLTLKNNIFYFSNFQDTLTLTHYYIGRTDDQARIEYPRFHLELLDTSVISVINDTNFTCCTNFPDSLSYDFLLNYKTTNIPANYQVNAKYVWECLVIGFTCEYQITIILNKTTGISETELYSFKSFPNPFSYSTTLQTDNFFKEATLTVYNSFGQRVKQIKNISGQTVTLNRDNLPSGLYFVHLTEDNKTITTIKLIITD